jgi:hypothetical protein
MARRDDCLNEIDKLNDEVRAYNNQLANERDSDKASYIRTEVEIRQLELEALTRLAHDETLHKKRL